jgi:hypothetical protein
MSCPSSAHSRLESAHHRVRSVLFRTSGPHGGIVLLQLRVLCLGSLQDGEVGDDSLHVAYQHNIPVCCSAIHNKLGAVA